MRTEHFGSSFYPNFLKEWNDLAPEMRELPTVTSFKSKLLSLVRPPLKSTYGICDPKGLAILTQLRVGLSKLKSHKFNHNFRDTVDPMCLINDGIEDTEHFLLQCHAYSEHRRDLLGAINEVLELHNISNLPNHTIVRTMLYDDERFTYYQNRQILEATVRFIRTSERFSYYLSHPPLYSFFLPISSTCYYSSKYCSCIYFAKNYTKISFIPFDSFKAFCTLGFLNINLTTPL